MQTKQANPRLASQAPNVNKINNMDNSTSQPWTIYIKDRVKITPSRAIKHISTCWRWIIKIVKDETTISLIETEPKTNIA